MLTFYALFFLTAFLLGDAYLSYRITTTVYAYILLVILYLGTLVWEVTQ